MTGALRREIDFLLHDWLKVGTLAQLPAFAAQDRADWDAFLDLSGAIAWNEFQPCHKASDRIEPVIVDGRVRVLPELAAAVRTYLDAGLQQATARPDLAGMGFPFSVATAAMAELMAANVAGSAFVMLSIANARVLAAFGSRAQIEAFALPQLSGVALGTMCLSEPDVGSSLVDITTRAAPDGEDGLGARYRLTGSKMWISAGDHDVTGNIVHLVLAKAVQPDGRVVPGAAGTSLFIVPAVLPAAAGGGRNDVVVAGLNHKMGYRGTPNCLLSLGEGGGAIGWRLGREGDGLRIMFQMMNEARINVGLSGAAMAYRGYDLSRRYALQRLQGRSVLDRSAERPVPLVRHPDVRRMLLAQKAIAEGALGLCLKAAMLSDIAAHAAGPAERQDAQSLLALLTPIVKSWPSEQGLVSLGHAIQVHGGYGYTRDFDVEQLYRDSRLNPIHEGTTGIQAIDLLGRKILSEQGASFGLLLRAVRHDAAGGEGFETEAAALAALCDWFEQVVDGLLASGRKETALANATGFLDAMGHFVLAWIWLGMARAAQNHPNPAVAEGKRWACRYFFAAEVPRIKGMAALLAGDPELTCSVPERVLAG
jgi:alkylation response protein AidB-like acyl-CoA dehydrogenase